MSKIEKSELESLNEIQKKFAAIRHDLGNMVIRKKELLKANDMVVEENNNLVKELEEKYGKVNINLEDGSYEEIKENE
jgi:hypothetical protein|tara:strand:+ start:464 stop:697 length:234 start_codon:yes stop_codon:yes gene_type:complete